MATSSFDKDFTLKTKSEVDCFIKIITNPSKSKIEIKRDMVSPELEKRGEEKLRRLLSR